MDTQQLLFTLIRSLLTGEPVSAQTKEFAQAQLRQLYILAAPQGLSPILGQALSDQKILGDDAVSQKIQNHTRQIFGIQMQQELAYGQICSCLEKHEIPFVPLKGSVIRKYYPQSWMRTSCDIDILVQEADLSKAVDALKEDLHYSQPTDREYHDVALYSPQGVLLELHFSLKENEEKLDKGLSKVWDYVISEDGHVYQKSIRKDFFVYHIVAHCAYHFMSSGCGAKPLLDLWLLKHRMGYEEETVLELCRISSLETFYTQIMALAEVWFAGAESNANLDYLASYILNAGFGGSEENAVAAAVLKKGSKGKYLLDRVFLPYDMLKEYYPVLNRHKWLMPICQVRRWSAGVKRKNLGTTLKAMKTGTNLSVKKIQTTQDLFKELDLL